MDWSIDRESPLPLYVQVQQLLRTKILDDGLTEGTKLPSEQELCEQLGVSRITVKRALDELAIAGLVTRIQGKGTLVNALPVANSLENVQGFSSSVLASGRQPGSKILSVDLRESDAKLRALFRLPSTSKERFYAIRRLLTVDGKPVVFLTVVVREQVGSQLLQHDLENASFYDLYRQISGQDVVRSEAKLVPIVATKQIAKLLQVTQGTPHFHYRSMNFLTNNDPIEYSVGVFAGDAFEWHATMYEVREEDREGVDLQLLVLPTV